MITAYHRITNGELNFRVIPAKKRIASSWFANA